MCLRTFNHIGYKAIEVDLRSCVSRIHADALSNLVHTFDVIGRLSAVYYRPEILQLGSEHNSLIKHNFACVWRARIKVCRLLVLHIQIRCETAKVRDGCHFFGGSGADDDSTFLERFALYLNPDDFVQGPVMTDGHSYEDGTAMTHCLFTPKTVS
ncbi:hypothetical protein A5664_14370 [Mycolicibacterium fortuitum]|nr:hypothetical protein A5668_16050 [Mycolicibacterium fortuitum]OBI66608.1 hypothetical protein A5664_14370 [Mycolicibacterium fortuitum]